MTTEIADEAAPVADGPSDAELMTAARAGSSEAFGQLYTRHVDAARRLARTLARNPTDVDDLVAEVFAKLLVKLRSGGGPDTAFRTYLLTSLRNTYYDRARRARKITVTDDVAEHDEGVPFVDTAIEGLERSLAARAFARLPERLQLVLWHTEVEGESPAKVAPLLNLTPNAVAALAYRARERLRQAYLQEHLVDSTGDDCGSVIEKLGTHVRSGLSNRESGRVRAHLSDCSRCRGLYADLREVNSGLRGVLAPVILGGSAAAYVATAGKAALSLASLWGGVRRTLTTWTGQVAIASGGVAAAGFVALVLSPHITAAQKPEDTVAVPRTTTEATPQASSQPKGTGPGSAAPGAQGTPGAPGASASPGQPGGSPGASPDTPGWGSGPSAPAPTNPADRQGEANVTLQFDPSPPLARGTNTTLVLTLTNTGWAEKPGKGPATASITGDLSLPTGVTLAAKAAGDGWRCVAISTGAVCRHPSVPAGQTTTARIAVTVAANAADGVPRMIITSTKIGSRTIYASSGVVDGGVAPASIPTTQPARERHHP
jgi:RNA polymerase sigma factor (sigma-70 family)